MNIKEISRESGLSQKVIRSYIKKGLITPQRSGNQYVFSAGDLQRLASVASLQQLDIPDADIHNRILNHSPVLDTALKNVRRQHRRQLLLRIILACVLVFIFILFWRNNFGTLTMTLHVTDVTITAPIKETHNTVILTLHDPQGLRQTFQAICDDSRLFEEIAQYGPTYSQAELHIRVPIRDALENELEFTGFWLTDQQQINDVILSNSFFARKYVILTSAH